MLADALKLLFVSNAEARKPIKLDASDDREAVYALDGKIVRVDRKPRPRQHEAGTLADLIAAANLHAEKGASPVVWYDASRVVLVLDDAGHRLEAVTLRLAESDTFQLVRGLHEREFEHPAFVRLLRVELAKALPAPALLDAVRKVAFTTKDDRSSEVRRDRSSMGREITAECKPEAAIPEAVTLQVPVFKTPGERDRYPLDCAVEVDHLRARFQLLPLPDEVDRVRQYAVDSIEVRLREGLSEAIPFFQGQP